MRSIYENVTSWKELCEINTLFVKGKIGSTFYHLAPLNNETTNNKEFLNYIIKLNESNIFTYSSQPTIITENWEQKSYINLCCEKNVALKLLPLLLADDEIYFSFYNYDEPCWISTFNDKIYWLSRQNKNSTWNNCTNWHKSNYVDTSNSIICNELITIAQRYVDNNNVYKLLYYSYDIFIVSRNLDINFSAPKKIFDLLNK